MQANYKYVCVHLAAKIKTLKCKHSANCACLILLIDGLGYWPFRLFSRHISRTQSFQENRPFIFQARVALKPLVSLIGRLVTCSARISIDRQTDRQTDKPTTVIPRCACAPRVNNWLCKHIFMAHESAVRFLRLCM